MAFDSEGRCSAHFVARVCSAVAGAQGAIRLLPVWRASSRADLAVAVHNNY